MDSLSYLSVPYCRPQIRAAIAVPSGSLTSPYCAACQFTLNVTQAWRAMGYNFCIRPCYLRCRASLACDLSLVRFPYATHGAMHLLHGIAAVSLPD